MGVAWGEKKVAPFWKRLRVNPIAESFTSNQIFLRVPWKFRQILAVHILCPCKHCTAMFYEVGHCLGKIRISLE